MPKACTPYCLGHFEPEEVRKPKVMGLRLSAFIRPRARTTQFVPTAPPCSSSKAELRPKA